MDGLYYCPTSREIESAQHGGFDVCCDNPDVHLPMPDTAATVAVSAALSEAARRAFQTRRNAGAFPEQLGPFTLHQTNTTWRIAYRGMWLPGTYADRDACLLIAGLILADSVDATDQLLVLLCDTYNKATPSIPITIEHIVQHTRPDENEDEEEDDQ